ncbi:MAG TPA: BrnA antitoxin family protein [Methylocella sp.]|nr:BrnA antitoxin family protein [Methylocella sp.]
MKKETSKTLTKKQAAEINALADLPEAQINTRDVPEQRDWSDAKRGLFFRPVKKQLTIRLDADLIAWFKSHTRKGEGYQTSINNALREYVSQREGV